MGQQKFNEIIEKHDNFIDRNSLHSMGFEIKRNHSALNSEPTPEEEEAFNMLEARNGERIGGTLTDEGTKQPIKPLVGGTHEAVVDLSHALDSEVAGTLAERQKRYGSFVTVAEATEAMVFCLDSLDGFKEAKPDQREAAHMILQKLARAFSGDPGYIDNWHDIQGYAKLVEDRLKEDQG